jgi:hypothetical protein
MNRIGILILITIGFLNCNDDITLNTTNDSIDQQEDSNQEDYNYNFIYTLLLENDLNDTIYKQEYSIVDGMVLAEKYTNYNNPQYNHLSSFKYDVNNRIIKEIRDNKVFIEVAWENNNAKVFNLMNEQIGEYHFDNSMKLISYDRNGSRYLNYDNHGNVVSVATNAGIYVEYLDYDNAKTYPLSRINSIAILRIDYKPHFKNVFKTEKIYPYVGDDFGVPLTFYEYFWTLNPDGLIETMTDDKTVIYLSKFEYK